MFNFFKKNPKTKDQLKLEKISSILFPPEQIRDDENGDKYYVDYSVDSNLEGALYDLYEGNNDEVVRNTIRYVCDQIYLIRDILAEHRAIPANINHYTISNNYDDKLADLGVVENDGII